MAQIRGGAPSELTRNGASYQNHADNDHPHVFDVANQRTGQSSNSNIYSMYGHPYKSPTGSFKWTQPIYRGEPFRDNLFVTRFTDEMTNTGRPLCHSPKEQAPRTYTVRTSNEVAAVRFNPNQAQMGKTVRSEKASRNTGKWATDHVHTYYGDEAGFPTNTIPETNQTKQGMLWTNHVVNAQASPGPPHTPNYSSHQPNMGGTNKQVTKQMKYLGPTMYRPPAMGARSMQELRVTN